MRRRAPRPIAIAVQALGGELAPQSTLTRAQSVWAQALGGEIAAQASPASEREGTLTVLCSAAVWAAELEMRSAELTDLVNAALPPGAQISRMRFRVR